MSLQTNATGCAAAPVISNPGTPWTISEKYLREPERLAKELAENYQTSATSGKFRYSP